MAVGASNPAAQCLPGKKDWETFVSAIDLLNRKMASFSIFSHDAIFPSGANVPTGSLAVFTYSYNHMVALQSSFEAQKKDVQSVIDALVKPPFVSDSDLLKLKSSYGNALADFENAYNTGLQTYKPFANPDGYLYSDLSSARALLADVSTQFGKYNADLNEARTLVSQFQKDLGNDHTNGCAYAFFDDRTVAITIAAEADFTLSKSSVEISGDYPPSSASVAIKTSLPIAISASGTLQTVMKLGCNEGAYRTVYTNEQDTYPAVRVDANTVKATVYPLSGRSFVNRWCSFTYAGNGTLIASVPVSIRI